MRKVSTTTVLLPNIQKSQYLSHFPNEWHSRGQRFDPAYLHQHKSLET